MSTARSSGYWMCTVEMQIYINNSRTLFRHITLSFMNSDTDVFYIGEPYQLIPYINRSTVYFDSSREDKYIPVNPLSLEPNKLAGIFIDSWYQGQMTAGSSYYQSLEHLHLTAMFHVLKAHDLNLLHAPFFLTNERYRNELLKTITDPLVKDFWSRKIEFKEIGSIYSKIYSLLLHKHLRCVFSSHRHSLEDHVVLVDLDDLARSEQRLLGSLFIGMTKRMVIVEDCSRYAPNILIDVIKSGQPVFLSFAHRDQLDEELYETITTQCRNVNVTVEKVWGEPAKQTEVKDFWSHHDRRHTRSMKKAEGDIKALFDALSI